MKKRMHNKAYFFTLDAFLSMGILTIGLVLLFSATATTEDITQVSLSSTDLLNFFARTKISEVNNQYAGVGGVLWQQGLITNYDNTLLEQLGVFYSRSQYAVAEQFIQNLTANSIPNQYRFEIRVDNTLLYPTSQSAQFIASKNNTMALMPARKLVSGYINEQQGTLYGPYVAEVLLWQYP